MSPGGHLATTAVACAASAFAGSIELTAGVAAGGFLIDLDHAADYVLFEQQRDLRPGVFLRYYLEGRVRRAVLILHSYELLALVALAAWWTGAYSLWGYLAGAVMHLALDVAFNGELTPRSIGAFYSFTYRLAHRFEMAALAGSRGRREAPRDFWRAFLRGAQPTGRQPAVSRVERAAFRSPSGPEGLQTPEVGRGG